MGFGPCVVGCGLALPGGFPLVPGITVTSPVGGAPLVAVACVVLLLVPGAPAASRGVSPSPNAIQAPTDTASTTDSPTPTGTGQLAFCLTVRIDRVVVSRICGRSGRTT